VEDRDRRAQSNVLAHNAGGEALQNLLRNARSIGLNDVVALALKERRQQTAHSVVQEVLNGRERGVGASKVLNEADDERANSAGDLALSVEQLGRHDGSHGERGSRRAQADILADDGGRVALEDALSNLRSVLINNGRALSLKEGRQQAANGGVQERLNLSERGVAAKVVLSVADQQRADGARDLSLGARLSDGRGLQLHHQLRLNNGNGGLQLHHQLRLDGGNDGLLELNHQLRLNNSGGRSNRRAQTNVVANDGRREAREDALSNLRRVLVNEGSALTLKERGKQTANGGVQKCLNLSQRGVAAQVVLSVTNDESADSAANAASLLGNGLRGRRSEHSE